MGRKTLSTSTIRTEAHKTPLKLSFVNTHVLRAGRQMFRSGFMTLFSFQMVEQQHLKSLCSNVNTMQQVLDEAGRLLKLVWRVSLPAANTAGDGGNNQQVNTHKHNVCCVLPLQ